MENLYSPLENSEELMGNVSVNKFCPFTLAFIEFSGLLFGQLDAISNLKSNFTVSKLGMEKLKVLSNSTSNNSPYHL